MEDSFVFLRQFQTHVFSDEDNYCYSRWASWEKRIQQGHTAEEKLIERMYNECKKQPSSDPFYNPDEWAGEDYMKTCHLTNSMYAALVVSIWSEMEHFLKDIVSLCRKARGNRRKALQKTQQFCKDSLARKLSNATQKTTLNSCIKALKELQAGIPYAFDEIKKAIEKEGCVKLTECANYAIVDAVRILNNSFKHSDGCYKPNDTDQHTQIDPALLDRWSVLDERNEIDYSKLPVKELVVACNSFCSDLLDKLEEVLKSKLGGPSDDA